jgi:hypothetical protein
MQRGCQNPEPPTANLQRRWRFRVAHFLERLVEVEDASGLHLRCEHPAAAIGFGLDDRSDVLAPVVGGEHVVEALGELGGGSRKGWAGSGC